MCVLLCFTEFIAIPKQLFAIYIFWTLKIQYSGTMEREWIRVKKLVFCPNFAHQFLFLFFLKNTQFQISLWHFHNYEHYIWIVFTPIVFSWLSAPPDPLPLLDIPLFLSCLFCVEGHAFNRGCFQKRGECCLQAHEPLTSGRELSASSSGRGGGFTNPFLPQDRMLMGLRCSCAVSSSWTWLSRS